MKVALLSALMALGLQSAVAEEDITFTYRIETFTNLQGQSFHHVQLVRGDRDGLIWREGASGGRICYTNLDPDLLESFGIPTNRIERARLRAGQKSAADAAYRAQRLAAARSQSLQAAKTNSTSTAHEPAAAVTDNMPRSPEYPYPAYPPSAYTPLFVYGLDPAPLAPNAMSAQGAASARGAARARTSVPAPSSIVAQRTSPAAGSTPALPAPRAAPAPVAPPGRPR